ncbi:MAG: 3-isopropylmalate/(R)-2-methylmalate dehydratase small subunit [Acidimicrobiales bacterium]|jgi:3-isopropylmalate/(R)-2-methylmalate dehydratase small subunit
MDAVRIVQGRAVPLERNDVDTDQIIPSDWLKQVERTGFEKGLFSEWRDDPDFVMNKEEHAGANVLLAGPNFGTGSSREHAVWAIMQYGFQAVISPRFGPIFANNSTKNGLVCVQVDQELGDQLMAAVQADPQLEFVVDVEKLRLEVPALDIDVAFAMDAQVQHRFLEGLDDIGLTMKQGDDISAFESTRPVYMPSSA